MSAASLIMDIIEEIWFEGRRFAIRLPMGQRREPSTTKERQQQQQHVGGRDEKMLIRNKIIKVINVKMNSACFQFVGRSSLFSFLICHFDVASIQKSFFPAFQFQKQ